MFFNKDDQMFESDFDDNNFDNFSGMEPFGKKFPMASVLTMILYRRPIVILRQLLSKMFTVTTPMNQVKMI